MRPLKISSGGSHPGLKALQRIDIAYPDAAWQVERRHALLEAHGSAWPSEHPISGRERESERERERARERAS